MHKKFLILYILITIPLGWTKSYSETIASIKPIIYPFGTIGNNQPCFIWQDIYNERDKKNNAKYRITITNLNSNNSNKTYKIIIIPQVIFKIFYIFKLQATLDDTEYEYSIERLIANKPVKTRHYYYLRYPIKNKFTINSKRKRPIDNLNSKYLIQYIHTDRNNTLINGYNALFFISSSITCFGMGMLFYNIINWGITSKIIAGLSFTSSAIGITASGYYGYRYLNKKKELQQIIRLSKKISLKGDINNNQIKAGMELSF